MLQPDQDAGRLFRLFESPEVSLMLASFFTGKEAISSILRDQCSHYMDVLMVQSPNIMAHSKNNPRMISTFYLSCVKELIGVPRILRGDRGTENENVAVLQHFFRRTCRDAW